MTSFNSIDLNLMKGKLGAKSKKMDGVRKPIFGPLSGARDFGFMLRVPMEWSLAGSLCCR